MARAISSLLLGGNRRTASSAWSKSLVMVNNVPSADPKWKLRKSLDSDFLPGVECAAARRTRRRVISCAAGHPAAALPHQVPENHSERNFIMKSVVITGASTGIGWATAKLLLD